MTARAPKRPKRVAKAAPVAADLPHITIEHVAPEIDGGRYPIKRVVGGTVAVSADVYKDGHDTLAARVRYRGPGDRQWRTAPLAYAADVDRWSGRFTVDRVGRWSYTVEAWTDRWATWRSGFEKKVAAGQDVSLELLEGALMVETASRRVKFGAVRRGLTDVAAHLQNALVSVPERVQAALAPELDALMAEHLPPEDLTTYHAELRITVDRERAGFAAWYELFPRSHGVVPGEHGTFRTAAERLPAVAALGFDVVYLPPIHPIGHTFRKGRNNTLTPEPDDVGSPWAIGSEEGGHDAVHPQLGTIDDFDHFVSEAARLGLEVALDFALQCSPDHPWVKQHPDWFRIRPDGSIQYAENPPKKYQDIYPINFWTEDREALWNACRDVLLFWIEHGVKAFRVDNPHTKPFAFWEWVIDQVQSEYPDVVFFSEAFTRPKKLLNLAKLGFTQSYTYFTWKNSAQEIRDWLAEMDAYDAHEYYRGNYFTNTPDILHAYLQTGGPAAFRTRLLLAGTLSPLYGIYSGFELFEGTPVRPGSEEYLNSEKYQLVWRDYDAEPNLNDDIRRLNRVRREHVALQRADNLTFHVSENDQVLFYHKAGGAAAASAGDGASAPRGEDLLVAVNLNPFFTQETMVHVPLAALGIGADETFELEDVLTGDRYWWRGARNYVKLDPARQAGHVFRVHRPGR
ncbi:MAG: alpha-1,4-glucan--maltose-1-phosphate maltosyltransferase [Gemmatimonadaceae bacterium]